MTEKADLVERLRMHQKDGPRAWNAPPWALIQEAADEIDKCGKENCWGHHVEGYARWVRSERLEEAHAQGWRAALEAAWTQCGTIICNLPYRAAYSPDGSPVVPPLSNAEVVVDASPSPPVGGGIDTEARKPDSPCATSAAAQSMPRWITAAAIRQVGFIASVEPPRRHHDIIHALARFGGPTTPICGEQGFLDSAGAFVNRKDAMRIAIGARQLIPRAGQNGPEGELYSEDLW